MRTKSRIIVIIIVIVGLWAFVPFPFSVVIMAAVLIPFWIIDGLKMKAKQKQKLESGWDIAYQVGNDIVVDKRKFDDSSFAVDRRKRNRNMKIGISIIAVAIIALGVISVVGSQGSAISGSTMPGSTMVLHYG